VSCVAEDSDTDQEDLIVDIEWSDNGVDWNELTEYFVSSEWRGNISTGTHSEDDVISYRCRGTDNETPELTSDWYQVTDYRTIGIEQTAPETPELLRPEFGERKYTIPVLCAGAFDGQSAEQRIYYELEVRKNETSWELLRNQSGLMLYSYNIANDGYGTTYDFRCRSFDGIEHSDYNTNINATIKKNIPVFSIVKTMDTPEYIKGKPYSQGYFIDVSALGSDYNIYKTTAECNNDGIIDFVKNGNNAQTQKGVFNCINQAGVIKHTIETYIYKNNTDEKWTQICTSLEPENKYCKLTREYEVTIDE